MNLVELYEQQPPERQRLLDEVNFLAAHLRDDLILEQFYLALSALTSRLQQLQPEIACPSGCSRCCESHALPEILPSEWRLIETALNRLPEATQARIKSAVQTAAPLLNHEGKLKSPRRTHSRFSCPLLIDGRCSVYAFRPFDCRITGYAFSVSGERPLPQFVPPGRPIPYTCAPEQQRMISEIDAQTRPLEYVFMPQREPLWEALKQIEPSDDPAALLLKHLQAWAAKI